DGIRDFHVTGVQTCALPIYSGYACPMRMSRARQIRPHKKINPIYLSLIRPTNNITRQVANKITADDKSEGAIRTQIKIMGARSGKNAVRKSLIMACLVEILRASSNMIATLDRTLV